MAACFDALGDWYASQIELDEARLLNSKKKDLVQSLLEDLETDKTESPEPPASAYFADRIETATQNKEQLRKEIELREQMHRRFICEIDSQMTYAQISLEQFSGWGVGYNTGVDVKRNHLERMLLQLRNDRRAAVLSAWQDLTRMRKELREAWNMYRDSRRLKDLD